MAITLCLIQSLQSLFNLVYIWLYFYETILPSRLSNKYWWVWVIPYSLFLSTIGVKHWIFTMKTWSTALNLEQILNKKADQTWVLQFTQIVYYFSIFFSVILPLGFLVFILLLKNNCAQLNECNWQISKWLFKIWLIQLFFSIIFLLLAYDKIQKVI